MNYTEVENLDDLADVVIAGRDLKLIYEKAKILGAGYAPKGEMCFLWGKQLLAIVQSSEELK